MNQPFPPVSQPYASKPEFQRRFIFVFLFCFDYVFFILIIQNVMV
jgi:hypothetical protein